MLRMMHAVDTTPPRHSNVGHDNSAAMSTGTIMRTATMEMVMERVTACHPLPPPRGMPTPLVSGTKMTPYTVAVTAAYHCNTKCICEAVTGTATNCDF